MYISREKEDYCVMTMSSFLWENTAKLYIPTQIHCIQSQTPQSSPSSNGFFPFKIGLRPYCPWGHVGSAVVERGYTANKIKRNTPQALLNSGIGYSKERIILNSSPESLQKDRLISENLSGKKQSANIHELLFHVGNSGDLILLLTHYR